MNKQQPKDPLQEFQYHKAFLVNECWKAWYPPLRWVLVRIGWFCHSVVKMLDSETGHMQEYVDSLKQ